MTIDQEVKKEVPSKPCVGFAMTVVAFDKGGICHMDTRKLIEIHDEVMSQSFIGGLGMLSVVHPATIAYTYSRRMLCEFCSEYEAYKTQIEAAISACSRIVVLRLPARIVDDVWMAGIVRAAKDAGIECSLATPETMCVDLAYVYTMFDTFDFYTGRAR